MRDQVVAVTTKDIVDALEAAGVREVVDVHAVERQNVESIHEAVALRGADARAVVATVMCEADVHVVAVIRAVGIIDLPHRRPRHLLPRHRYRHLVAVAGDAVVNLLVFRQVWPLRLVSWML